MYRLSSTPEQANAMFDRLSYIMNSCSNPESVIEKLDRFLTDFSAEKKFLHYFHTNWIAGDKLCKFSYCTLCCFLLFSMNILLALTQFLFLGMWVKGCRDFPHANQEMNNFVEAYHCFLKSKFLSDRRKRCARRMDWLLYQLIKCIEPYYRFREILKGGGYLNNYKNEKQLESSMEREKQIPDCDCWPHENISHGYWVRS